MYRPPHIESSHCAARTLKDLPGTVLAISMDIPWDLLQKQYSWTPHHLHMVSDVGLATLELLNAELPSCDVVVGIGGGSCCDTAKYLAWKRQCRMVLVPTIVSVDAPLTNMVAVRIDDTVAYVGDIWPEEILIDYDLIQQAPKHLNRAGAADIASIHTALYDWQLAHDHAGEPYFPEVAQLARDCLDELDRNAAAVYAVTPKGIDTIVDLYRREVEFCARIGASRPEEGSEHLVAYNLEHLTGRHFVHGDVVAVGIFAMSHLQRNEPEWARDLMDRLGLRYRAPDVVPGEIRQCLATLKTFKTEAKFFYSIVDAEPITGAFIDSLLAELYR